MDGILKTSVTRVKTKVNIVNILTMTIEIILANTPYLLYTRSCAKREREVISS